ncbi:MAG: hypothetical protein II119_03555 [Bacilli bacterium]|nr:hypothetical protein [Bacilli bacterium]MBQ6282798.1 hypothetical protein [Bacilli bacterium]
MKKVLVFLIALLSVVSVNASMKTDTKNIKIENVKVEVSEHVGYNEELKIKYSINPRDAKNLELNWEISGLKNGVKATFVNGKTTKEADGEVVLKVENTLDKDVKLTIKATQNKKTYFTKELVVETKNNTVERVTKEVNGLIEELDEKLNNKNYESNKEIVDSIEELLEKNPEVKDKISSDLLVKYDNAKASVDNYKDNKNVIIGVSVGLAVVFSGLMFWIFKKEEK